MKIAVIFTKILHVTRFVLGKISCRYEISSKSEEQNSN